MLLRVVKCIAAGRIAAAVQRHGLLKKLLPLPLIKPQQQAISS
jgi:hypothetical protein